MDFSSVLAKEISKKRKVNSKPGASKRINLRAKPEIRHQEHPTDVVSETIAAPSEHGDSVTPTKHIQPDHFKYTPEEQELLNSITDDQLREKLSEFSETVSVEDKLTNVKKLQILTRNQNRLIKYKDQVESESKLYDDPQKKLIQLEHLTNVTENQNELYLQLRVYIKDLVKDWENHGISGQESHEQESLLFETKADLVKLLYKLRARKLPENMLTSLSTIMYYIQNQDFRKANESYMKLSIGNVAWPIGVRDVGIHARSADSKITKANANIMIDDNTRRWITAIKRLVTFSERKSNTLSS